MPNETPYDDDRLTAYLDDQMDADQRARFESELTTNAELRDAVDELRSLGAAIRELPLSNAPADLASVVLDKINADSKRSTSSEPVTLPVDPADKNSGRRRGVFWAAVAVAAAVAIMVWGPSEPQVAIGPTSNLDGPGNFGAESAPEKRVEESADEDVAGVAERAIGGGGSAVDSEEANARGLGREDKMQTPKQVLEPSLSSSSSRRNDLERQTQIRPADREGQGIDPLREELAEPAPTERQDASSLYAVPAAPSREAAVETHEADTFDSADVAAEADSDLALDDDASLQPAADATDALWSVYRADIDVRQYESLRAQFDRTRRAYDDRELLVSDARNATVDSSTVDRNRKSEDAEAQPGQRADPLPALEAAPQLLQALGISSPQASSSLRLLTIAGDLDELRLSFEAANLRIERLAPSAEDQLRPMIQSLEPRGVASNGVAAPLVEREVKQAAVSQGATIVLILRIADGEVRPLADDQP